MIRLGRNAEALGLVAGFALWAFAFVTLYGGHGFACAVGVSPGNGDGATRLVLILLYGAFLVAHLALALWLRRRWRDAGESETRFIRLVAFVLGLAALGTTAWTGLPVLTLSICS